MGEAMQGLRSWRFRAVKAAQPLHRWTAERVPMQQAKRAADTEQCPNADVQDENIEQQDIVLHARGMHLPLLMPATCSFHFW